MAQRDEKGRFVAGWAGGPGRPKRVIEEQTFAALAAKYSNGRLSTMLDRLGTLTDTGDLGAIKLVLAYLIGQPVQRTESAATEELAELLREWRSGKDSGTNQAPNSD